MRVNGLRSFSHDGWQYDFVADNGRISQLLVTVPVEQSDPLPEIIPNAEDRNSLDLRLNQPSCSDLLIKSLRTLEGFLSVYGLERIALDEADISWVPETEEEKERLKIGKFSLKFTKPDDMKMLAPFSVVSRSIIAAKNTLDWDVPLGFFRKGRNDFLERRYIDAIYDFYFLLETVFGNGKTKNAQVAMEFKNSAELVAFTGQVLKNGEQSILRRGGRKNLLDTFLAKYSNKSTAEYLECVVNLRGFLHHHSSRNKNIWNPALEFEYELDALLLQNLCFEVCCKKVESLICSPIK